MNDSIALCSLVCFLVTYLPLWLLFLITQYPHGVQISTSSPLWSLRLSTLLVFESLSFSRSHSFIHYLIKFFHTKRIYVSIYPSISLILKWVNIFSPILLASGQLDNLTHYFTKRHYCILMDCFVSPREFFVTGSQPHPLR